MSAPLRIAFAASETGPYRIDSIITVIGDDLPPASHLSVLEGGEAHEPPAPRWILRGTTSHMRYSERREVEDLVSRQEGLGRSQARRAALIPIRKSDAWWSLPQDERRAIFEETSHHIRIGLDYLPGIARRLHHARDLGEPFDFLTWFDYAPGDAEAFEHLVARLRRTEEWRYVVREIDIRLTRL